MKIQIDYEIYHWLIALKVLKSSPQHQIKKSGRYELDIQNSVLFQNGKKFFDIALNLSFLFEKSTKIDKFTLKEGNTAIIRQYNWNLLANLFQNIGIQIDSDIKNLIINGDSEIINECLKDIYAIAYNSLEKLSESLPNVRFSLDFFAKTLIFRQKMSGKREGRRAILRKVAKYLVIS